MKPKIISKIQEYTNIHGKEKTMRRLRIGEYALNSLLNFHENSHLNTRILRSLYTFFDINLDDFYYRHFEKIPSMKRHEWIIGNIFRSKRIRLGMTILDVARALKVDEKTIDRLERWQQLPSISSYTMIQLMELYKMTEIEKETLKRLIIVIYDAREIFKKELENW